MLAVSLTACMVAMCISASAEIAKEEYSLTLADNAEEVTAETVMAAEPSFESDDSMLLYLPETQKEKSPDTGVGSGAAVAGVAILAGGVLLFATKKKD